MVAPESGIARCMFAVLTIGVGLVALQTQSDFWFGALVVLAALWGALALGGLVGSGDRRGRGSWIASVIASTAWLGYGFGPWSDAPMRGALPADAKDMAGYVPNLLPSTIAMIRLSHHIKPCHRAEIRTFDRSGRPDTRVVLTGRPHPSSRVDRLTFEIEQLLDPRMDAFTRKYSGPGFVVVTESLDVYFNTCYLLAALFIGGIAGLGVAFVRRRAPKDDQAPVFRLGHRPA